MVDTDGSPPPSGEPVELPSRSRRLTTYVVIPVAVVVALFFWLLATSDSGSNRGSAEAVGEVAPAIVGTTLDGEVFDLDDLQGRWVVVNFFATWCPPCIREHPELVEFSERHAQIGDAAVVSVAFENRPSEVAAFFDEYGGEWAVLAEDTGGIAIDYGVVGVPESYLVSPTGFVAQKFTGGVTAQGLDNAIVALEERARAAVEAGQ